MPLDYFNSHFIPALKAAYIARSFPAAAQISVLDNVPDFKQGLQFRCRADTFNERDIIADHTLKMPVVHLSDEPYSNDILLRYRDRKGNERDVAGCAEQVYQVVEGPAFLTTLTGSRFSAAYASSTFAQDAGHTFQGVAIMALEQGCQSPYLSLRHSRVGLRNIEVVQGVETRKGWL